MGQGRGYGTSGNKKRANVGNRSRRTTQRGPGMDEILQGEIPAKVDPRKKLTSVTPAARRGGRPAGGAKRAGKS